MANSRFEHVRLFEDPCRILPNTWIVVRIDGHSFHKLASKYAFTKPNDRCALDLMNAAGLAVLNEIPEICLAYGQSDEYSFIFHKRTTLFERRAYKLTTTVVSIFTASYNILWARYFPDNPLSPPYPNFDGRPVAYPTNEDLRDYLSWRQADCHINNLYNTTFWALLNKGGLCAKKAQEELQGTLSSDKNEILFQKFGVNYNDELDMFKKGSVIFRRRDRTGKILSQVEHIDVIKDSFWRERPWILQGKLPPRMQKANGERMADANPGDVNSDTEDDGREEDWNRRLKGAGIKPA